MTKAVTFDIPFGDIPFSKPANLALKVCFPMNELLLLGHAAVITMITTFS